MFAYIRRRLAIRRFKKLLAEFPEPSPEVIAFDPDATAKAFQFRERLKRLIAQLENNDDPRATAAILLRGSGIGRNPP